MIMIKSFVKDIFVLPKSEKPTLTKKEKINNIVFYLETFALTMCILLVIAIAHDISPFGERTFMAIDAWGQYFPMLREMKRAFKSLDWSYSFTGALGFDLTAQSAYYTNSPLWYLLFLLPGELTPGQVDIMVLVRFALAATTFCYYLSRHFGTRRAACTVFGIAYAFSGYTLAFINQFMWMDAVVLLPLVLLGIEKLCRDRDYILYTVSLFLTIFSNFYIGFSVCLFSVIWFLLQSVIEFSDIRRLFVRAFRFGVCSLAAGALNLPVLIPVAKAIGNTLASSKGFGGELEFYHTWSEMFARLLPFQKSSLAYEAPNLYFGAVCAVLAVIALLSKTSVKKKIGYFAVIAFMFVSFNFNLLDYVWHGFHFPNQLPGRQSFLFIFVCLVAAYAGFTAIINESVGKPKLKKTVSAVLCALISLEAVSNAALHFVGDTKYVNEAHTLRNAETIEAIADKYNADIDENEFYRIELASHRYNGGQLYGYYGVSHYSSTMSGACYKFFTKIGMSVYAKNVSIEYLPNPVLDSLLGVKYLMSESEEPNETSKTLEKIGNLQVQENETVLPLFYVVNKDVLELDESLSGYSYLNEIFKKMTLVGDVIEGSGEFDDEKNEGYILNTDEFEKGIAKIKESETVLTKVTTTKIEGSVNAAHDGLLVISLPAADCTVSIDGKKVEVLTVAGYLASVELTKGEHEVIIELS